MRREIFRIRKFIRKYDRRTGKFTINIRYKIRTEITERTMGVAEAFGIGVDDREQVIYDNVEFKIGPRDIVYITGESGSGKSVLLRAFEKDLGDQAFNIDRVKVNPDKPIVETVGSSLEEALELLSRVGLNDAYLFVRRYQELSDGQKYRYRLAKLMESNAQFWIMDEFCSTLDRETAKIVAFNVQKQARRMGKAVIAATTHTDLFEDLAPSVHIHKGWGRRLQVRYYPNRLNRTCSVAKDLRIEEGTLEDYKRLAEFHYRNPKTHPIPLKIFMLRRPDGEPVGVIFYSHPPINAFGRRKAFGRQLSIAEINRCLATISRVILHPKYRSIGLGSRLVRETLPLVGREYVETIAVMAKYNPFFERAGMKKIAISTGDETVQRAVKKLVDLGFKQYLLASEEMNLKILRGLSPEEKEEVRKAVLGVSRIYYKRLRPSRKPYVEKAKFEQFISEASDEVLAKVLSRLAVLAQTKVYLIWKRKN